MRIIHQHCLNHETLRLIGEIDEFKGEWTARSGPSLDRLSLWERTATLESVGAAVRMAGGNLTDRHAERIVMGLELRKPETFEEQQALGYAEALKLTHTSWRAMNLCTDHIRQLHGVLLKHSLRDRHHRGKITRSSEQVEELVLESRSALKDNEIHPLFIIAAFEAEFLEIHPFQDGNGRLARILTGLLLLRSGYGFVPYSSREKVIEELDGNYAQDQWLLFALHCLKAQMERLKARLAEVQVMASLPELSEKLLDITRNHGRLTMGEAVRLLGRSRDTLKPHFRRLVEEGRLERLGKGKGTVYSLS